MSIENPQMKEGASLFADIQKGSAVARDEAVYLFVAVAGEVQRLHEAGRLHRAISLDSISVSKSQGVSLGAPPATCQFGGSFSDPEFCPPELRGSSACDVPVELDSARNVLAKAGTSVDPVRIDIYQLATLLCRLLTGESVQSYLRSPRTKQKVPADLQPIIDRVVSYESSDSFQSVAELSAAVQAVSGESAATDPTVVPLTPSQSDTAPSIVLSKSEPDTDLDTTDNSQAAGIDVGQVVPSSPERKQRDDLPVKQLAHYEIIEKIGQGGMGDVYKAYERALDRTVAIKVLPAEFSRDDEFVARFYAEATAAARLSHPNIIDVYFIGEDEGRHFFSMQFVEGESLADLLSQNNRLSVEQSLPIVTQTLAGLAAAHRQGMVHRDVKPGNILIDRENRRCVVADFGLVKSLQGANNLTATGTVMGTVDYISPEQGKGQPVDARSDLYAVGVLLYRMLSGQLPFQADSPTAMIFQHVYEKATPLKEVATGVPPVLSAIVEKLMAKAPDERYASAADVLSDLRAFREDNPLPSGADVISLDGDDSGIVAIDDAPQSIIIEAPNFDQKPELPANLKTDAPTGIWGRLRNRLIDSIEERAPEFLQYLQNTQQQVDGAVDVYERRQRDLEKLVGEAESVLRELDRQADEWRNAADEARQKAKLAASDDETHAANRTADRSERERNDIAQQSAAQREELEAIQLRLAKVNSRLAQLRSQRGLLNARLKVAEARLKLSGGKVAKRRIPFSLSWLSRLRWSRTTQAIAAVTALCLIAATSYGLYSLYGPKRAVTVEAARNEPKQNAEDKTVKPTVGRSDGGQQEVGLTGDTQEIGPSGERIIRQQADVHCLVLGKSTGGQSVRFACGNEDGTISTFIVRDDGETRGSRILTGHLRPVNCIAYSPDFTRIASGSEDGTIRVWQLSTGRELRRLEGHTEPVHAVVFSADGSHVLSGSRDDTIRLWDVQSGVEVKQIATSQLRGWVQSLAWLSRGNLFLAGARVSGAQSMSLWDMDQEQEIHVYDTSKNPTSAIALTPSGERAISLSSRSIHVWDVASGAKIRQFGQDVREASFSGDARRVLTGNRDHSLTLWDAETGKEVQSYSGHTRSIIGVALSADARTAVSASHDGTLRVWKLPPLPPPEGQLRLLTQKAPVASVAFSPDGFFAVAGDGQRLTVCDLTNPRLNYGYGSMPSNISVAAFSPDARQIVYASSVPNSKANVLGIRIATTDSRKRFLQGSRDLRLFKGHEGHITTASFSHDGLRVISGSLDGTVRVWDVQNEKQIKLLDVGHPINSLAVAPNDDHVLIGSNQTTVDLWTIDGAEMIRQFKGHTFLVNSVRFNKDGTRAVSGSGDRTIRIWDVATGAAVGILKGHTRAVNAVAMSADGQYILSGADDTSVRLWDVKTGKQIAKFTGHIAPVRGVAISPDGHLGLSCGDDMTIRFWDIESSIRQFSKPIK